MKPTLCVLSDALFRGRQTQPGHPGRVACICPCCALRVKLRRLRQALRGKVERAVICLYPAYGLSSLHLTSRKGPSSRERMEHWLYSASTRLPFDATVIRSTDAFQTRLDRSKASISGDAKLTNRLNTLSILCSPATSTNSLKALASPAPRTKRHVARDANVFPGCTERTVCV